ncbi:MAG: hypothetical protein AAFR79_06385 [Pseudomonadota bacterium]
MGKRFEEMGVLHHYAPTVENSGLILGGAVPDSFVIAGFVLAAATIFAARLAARD